MTRRSRVCVAVETATAQRKLKTHIAFAFCPQDTDATRRPIPFIFVPRLLLLAPFPLRTLRAPATSLPAAPSCQLGARMGLTPPDCTCVPTSHRGKRVCSIRAHRRAHTTPHAQTPHMCTCTHTHNTLFPHTTQVHTHTHAHTEASRGRRGDSESPAPSEAEPPATPGGASDSDTRTVSQASVAAAIAVLAHPDLAGAPHLSARPGPLPPVGQPRATPPQRPLRRLARVSSQSQHPRRPSSVGWSWSCPYEGRRRQWP